MLYQLSYSRKTVAIVNLRGDKGSRTLDLLHAMQTL